MKCPRVHVATSFIMFCYRCDAPLPKGSRGASWAAPGVFGGVIICVPCAEEIEAADAQPRAYTVEVNPDYHGRGADRQPIPFYRVRLLRADRFSSFVHTRCTSVEQARKLAERDAPGAVYCETHEAADAYIRGLNDKEIK